MFHQIHYAALLLVAAALPAPVSAQDFLGIDFSDVKLTAFASASTQLQPTVTDSVTRSAPQGVANSVDALVHARGVPFPNLPNRVGSSFASAAGDGNGLFGVGVNGFFFTNSLPPDDLVAQATFSQTFVNNSALTVSIFADITIPAPTLLFFGVGDFFPAGADPRRDVTASANARVLTKITHANGSVVDAIAFDYGLSVFREPTSGRLLGLDDDGAVLPRFEEFDGSFGFQLANFHGDNIEVATFGPGDTLELTLDYFATASTGFGETGIFAAIGDPFELSASGGQFDIHLAAPIPEPATWTLLAAGLVAFRLRVRARAANAG